MPRKTYVDAIREALAEELRRDPSVEICFDEDQSAAVGAIVAYLETPEAGSGG